jgi:hypothetical protein
MTRTPGHFFTGRPRSGSDRNDSAKSNQSIRKSFDDFSVIRDDERGNLLQIG